MVLARIKNPSWAVSGEARRLLPAALLSLLFAGCASPDPRPAFSDVQGTIQNRLGQQVRWMGGEAVNAEIAQLVNGYLQNDLTAGTAVAIGLVNNRSLQAEFEEIGISQAELAQASRLKNPDISGLFRFPDRPPSAVDMEYSATFNFLDLLTLPAQTRMATTQLEQVKLKVADEVLKLADEIQAAFYTLQARRQLLAALQTSMEINAAAADFARRLHDAGNINDLAFHQQQAAYAQSQLELVRARTMLQTDREKLNRLLGLSSTQLNWKMAGDLPALPESEPSLAALESLALKQRLDLAASHSAVQALAAALHLQENTRWIPGLTLGVDVERQSDSQVLAGPFIGLELPIFDQGQPELAKLTAQFHQAEHRYEAQAINICSEVREAGDILTAAREMAALYRETLVPQRQQIVRETLLQYNAMQVGSHELLAAREGEQIAQRGYIEALRDYWIARSSLERAVGGRLEEAAPPAPTGPTSPKL